MTEHSVAYNVLARKYRPSTINELIGQEVLVETLSNAFKLNRIAHAFMLTGVRGVGKTTTARILAKALNCIGIDGNSDMTLSPCGVCDNCIAITSGRHLDILEIDAASRTGIDDIREIIETLKYKPVSARYKIYIIDEIHMLSKNAFNALLKTLEEPPKHIKFIFATTEIRKVPVTILSRCQRFDLKRVSTAELSKHLENISKQENINYEPAALTIISKAAGGSVRDSLSLLDQAIIYCEGNILEVKISAMLGQNSKETCYLLLEAIIKIDKLTAFEIYNKLYLNGAELDLIFEDLLDVCHLLTMLLVVPTIVSQELAETEKKLANNLCKFSSIDSLSRLWQILLQGINEIKTAIYQKNTADMLLVKLLWAAELPSIDDLLSNLEKKNPNLALPATQNNIEDNFSKINPSPNLIKGSPPPYINITSTNFPEPRSSESITHVTITDINSSNIANATIEKSKIGETYKDTIPKQETVTTLIEQFVDPQEQALSSQDQELLASTKKILINAKYMGIY